jgi:anaerobic selenocysteine-containing dehydrogenase
MPSPFTIVHTVCSHDCPDSCGVLVTVNKEGQAVKVQGDPAHPVTKGFLCGKVAKYLDRVYSPDRLLYPMRRRRGVPKGPLPRGRESEAFERISWDDALAAIAEKFQEISDTYGSESILPYSYAGTIGVLGYGSMDRRFFYRLGASRLNRTICSEAGGEALLSVYGCKLGTDTEQFHHAKLILAWGANIHGNNVHLWPQIEQARRSGARLIVIDPYRTRTARLADWHIAIHPGTDAALALGMMHVLLRDGLEDQDYISKYTYGIAQLREHVRQYTPEKVAAWTGLRCDEVEQLAREYATAIPAVIRMNYGVQRAENGGTAARAIAMLPCLTGAWKHLGGGLQLSTSGAFQWSKQALERPDLMLASPLGRETRIVNMSALGQALTELEHPRVHCLFVYNSNPAAVAPNQNAVLRGMARPDLFTIVHEQFFTDTTDYADIVLPATTFLEHKDIQGAYGHYYVQLSQQAIAPLGEARSNVWLFGQLGQRMNFPEDCFRDTTDDLIHQALRLQENGYSGNRWMEPITIPRLEKEGHIRLAFETELDGKLFMPFAEGGFRTPSGRAEFYSSTLEAQGLDPLPTFHPATESRLSPAAAQYPLEFLARKADNYMNSTFGNLEGHRRMESRIQHRLEIHPNDATQRGISDGDSVEIFNARGRLRLEALLSDAIPPGVVAGQLDWNKLATEEQNKNVNVLTSEQLTDLGQGASFYSTLVEVRRVQSSAPVTSDKIAL